MHVKLMVSSDERCSRPSKSNIQTLLSGAAPTMVIGDQTDPLTYGDEGTGTRLFVRDRQKCQIKC